MKLRTVIATIINVSLLICPSGVVPSHAKEVLEHILLVPAGDVDSKVIDRIKSELPSLWPVGLSVEIFPSVELPAGSRDPLTGQYNAAAVLNSVSSGIMTVPATERIMVVTSADLYLPGAGPVSGLADQKLGGSIISTARLDNAFFGLPQNGRLLEERSLKEAFREAAHSRGLGNCDNPRCVMHASTELADMDKKRAKPCNPCYNRLYGKYGTLLFKIPGL